jgi:hypothetical protein
MSDPTPGPPATGPTTSTSTVLSTPFSRASIFGSCEGGGGASPSTAGRSSYNTGENLTATLAFL